jgi:hypothetical protein
VIGKERRREIENVRLRSETRGQIEIILKKPHLINFVYGFWVIEEQWSSENTKF